MAGAAAVPPRRETPGPVPPDSVTVTFGRSEQPGTASKDATRWNLKRPSPPHLPTAQPLPVGLGQEPARQAGTWSQLFALKEEHKMLKIHLKLACEKIIVREKIMDVGLGHAEH